MKDTGLRIIAIYESTLDNGKKRFLYYKFMLEKSLRGNVLYRFAFLTFFDHSPRFMIVSLHYKIMHQDFSSISEIYDSLVAVMKLLRLKISLLLFITYMV